MALSPQHRKRLIQGVAAYVLVVAATGAWLYFNAAHTLENLQHRTPSVSVDIARAESTESNASAEALPETAPSISIIFTNAGMSASVTKNALEALPKQVAFAFSPYPAETAELMKSAQEDKRDTLILIPMEPASYPKEDPGPKALLTRLSEQENQKSLNSLLARAEGTVGAINYMGSRFLSDEKSMTPVFTGLKAKNLFFIEDSALPTAATAMAAQQADIGYMAADFAIDDKPSEQNIRQNLIELERRATEKGRAIGIMHPYPVSISTLQSWASTLDNRGIRLVPLSDMIKLSAEHDQNQTTGEPGQPHSP